MKTTTNIACSALARSISQNLVRWLSLTLLLGISSFLVQSTAAQEPVAAKPDHDINPLQVALLKWSTNRTTTFAVGANPLRIAFDGASVWVTNEESFSVTKVRASDGAVQGNFTVRNAPVGISFDGANIWVANANGANVSKLRASDGALLRTFTVG